MKRENRYFEVLLFLNSFSLCFCNIWTLLQSSPIQGQISKRLSTHPRNIHAVVSRNMLDQKMICDKSSDCNSNMFCDLHYGICDYHRTLGEPCREDSHCEGHNICMYGQCEKRARETSRGARCQTDKDCDSSMCCARRHGERICQPKLKIGQKCYVPKGGLDYSLNQVCPCLDGLHCRTTSKTKSTSRKSGWHYYNFFEHLRCSK
ncbi:dickkopf-related protein 3 [Octopus bimaculoides]|uniref:Dickkopf N-terminal cysteine-rich domain-containing protein n=1 Tax=Octopus bimaculoides TaxID=37653 RepID=A0A0L8HNQ2_OCTBM|nr:dickkopf-related protein 3 [Octopus bimaculoides]|eukprot:XP_014770799.1 PREDICTED: dickkopf-related protein 3-like [Octopus bimaculoides]